MTTVGDFIAWSLSPDRTLEERWSVEKAAEWGTLKWRQARGLGDPYNFEQKQELYRGRRLNPAYEPKLDAETLRHAAGQMATQTAYYQSGYNDRAMRDVKWLRFFPQLEEVQLDNCEVEDYTPLHSLPKLRKLRLTDPQTLDLRVLGGCAALEELMVTVGQPWIQVDGLERLERLQTVWWNGGLHSLQAVPSWPAMRKATLKVGHSDFPLRDARQLPAMPLLEELDLESVASLEGIGRYERLVNLHVAGPYRSVEPVTALKHLTHLFLRLPIHLHQDLLADVSPLVKLPELRYLEVRSERPRDYTALVEAPKLRELSVLRCAGHAPLAACAMQQATINEMLTPWDEDFLLPTPRPVPPLKVVYYNPRTEDPSVASTETELDWERNSEFLASEKKYLVRRVAARMDKTFGKDWGSVWQGLHLNITSQETAEDLRRVLELVRSELAQLRRRHQAIVVVKLEFPALDEEEDKAEMRRLREEADREDWERREKEKMEFLERQHRMELQKEAGRKIRPEDFAVPDAVEPEKDEERTAQEDIREICTMFEPERPHPLAEQYWCYGVVHEDAVYYNSRERDTVEYLLGGGKRG